MRYRILVTTILAVLIAIGLAACSGEESSGQAAWYSRNTLYSYSGRQGNLWDRMRKDSHMPLYTYTPQVRQQIRWYQNHQAYLNHVIAESAPYIYYIYQQTQERHLPTELALIPVIESDYNPYARSSVGAMGLWQMMPRTARGFGLKNDWFYDGRRDVVASTNAALEYFTDLHSMFHGDWLLAIASYDCGEGTVMNAIRYNEYHHRSGDFWNLPLPSETRGYVPRLLAVAAIIKSPHRYGINLAPIDDAPYLTQVNVGSPIALSKAAKLAQVPLSTMKVLNPALQHGTTDPRGPYTLIIPRDKADTFKQKLAALTHNEKLLWQEHVVKSRESLEEVAKKYKTNLALLKEVNNLKSNRVRPYQTLLIPPSSKAVADDNDKATDGSTPTNDTANTAEATIAANTETSVSDNDSTSTTADDDTAAKALTVMYEVKNEDNLQKIAHKFHVTTSALRHANGLTSNKIKVGQNLTIPTSEKTKPIHLAVKHHSHSHHHLAHKKDKIYIVRRGDDIEKIARHHDVTVEDLKKWNQALSDSHLKPGQKIILQADASS